MLPVGSSGLPIGLPQAAECACPVTAVNTSDHARWQPDLKPAAADGLSCQLTAELADLPKLQLMHGRLAQGTTIAAAFLLGVAVSTGVRLWLRSYKHEKEGFVRGVEGLVGNTPLILIKSLSEATGCKVSLV